MCKYIYGRSVQFWTFFYAFSLLKFKVVGMTDQIEYIARQMKTVKLQRGAYNIYVHESSLHFSYCRIFNIIIV